MIAADTGAQVTVLPSTMSSTRTRVPDGRSHLEAKSEPFGWSSAVLLYALAAAGAIVIVGFWWAATGYRPVRSPGDGFNDAGRLTGLLGTYTALLQLLLMARVPWLEGSLGMERIVSLHRWNGYLTLGLLVAHAVFQTAGYALIDNVGLLPQLGAFINGYEGVLAAIVALLLLGLVTVLSITIARARLSYETWYFVHLYAYLAIALAFSHEILVGTDFISSHGFVAFWAALYAFVFASLVGFRVLMPLLVLRRHRLRVHSVVREAHGATSIYIAGRNLQALDIQAGQFMIWRFLDGRRWWQAHPFTVSAPVDARRLRITARSIGDFTGSLAKVRPGTRVLVEGPFGAFTSRRSRRRKVLLIAAGVGITPLRPLAEEMAREGRDVWLLYRCHAERDIILRDELDQLARDLGVRVEYLLSEGPGAQGHESLSEAGLRDLVPDIKERAVYVCGPAELAKQLRSRLAGLGVERGDIHTEAFRF
ncbi:MAG TPA: ferredoxin reductase family protein [Candidatus Dormibacteraeota bacterium]